MRSNKQFQRGFTYIEVVITVLLMGILAGMAAPSYFTSIASYQAEMAAKRVVHDLHFARSEAQRSSQSRTVRFDTETNSYSLEGVADINASANGYVTSLSKNPFSATLVSASLGGDAVVVFDMYGRPDSDGTVVVQAGSVQRTVELSDDGEADVL